MDPSGGVTPGGRRPNPQQAKTPVRDGAVREITVISVKSGGAVVARMGRTTIEGRTPLPLTPGQKVRVRIRVLPNGIQFLDAPKSSVEADSGRVALRSGDPDRAMMRAFVRAGLPLHEARLSRASRRASSSRLLGGDRERRDQAARAEAKGILDSDWVWEAIGGCSERERDTDEDRPGSQRREKKPHFQQAVDHAFRTTSSPEAPIHLYNHVVGRGDHWIFIPIDFPSDQGMRAELHICIPRAYALSVDRTGHPLESARLHVEAAGTEWSFVLTVREGRLQVEPLAGGEGPASPDLEPLRQRLAGFEVVLTEPANHRADLDGFSSHEGDAIIPRVDGSA
jgi:hypothetical protein